MIYLIAKPDFRLAPKANACGDAPFPLELIERIIGSTKAQVVLDPFMGSGTTAVAAKNLGRDYIGVEVAEQYCAMSRRRLAGEAWNTDKLRHNDLQSTRRVKRG